MTLARSFAGLLPGLVLAAAIAAAARYASRFLPTGSSEVLVAILLGLLVANFVSLPTALTAVSKPGLRFAVQRVLRLGIILLGARLSLVDIARIGGGALGLVVISMCAALAVAWV